MAVDEVGLAEKREHTSRFSASPAVRAAHQTWPSHEIVINL
jgi:hypothetical protein